MENIHNDDVTAELPAWHKPALQQLTISLDTGFETGSAVDGVIENPGNFTV